MFAQANPLSSRCHRIRKNNQSFFYYNTSGGKDGLEFIGALIEGVSKLLKKGGKLQIVIVDYLGTDVTLDLMHKHRLEAVITFSLKTELSPMTTIKKGIY